MKLKHIAAAMALIATGAANAAIATGANGSLVLIAYDKSPAGSFNNVAGVFDLGVAIDDLIGATSTTTAPTAASLLGSGKSLQWDLVGGSLKVDGAATTAYGAFDFGSAWSTLAGNVDADNFSFVLTAFDTTGIGAGKRSLVTGLPTAAANFNSTSGTNIQQISGSGSNNIFAPIANKGTIGTAANGAYTFTTADGAASLANGYVMAGEGFGNEWRSQNVLQGETLVTNTTALYAVNGSGNKYKLAFGGAAYVVDLNEVNGTLSISAVPEPTTYALAIAGLAIVGAAARRRRAA